MGRTTREQLEALDRSDLDLRVGLAWLVRDDVGIDEEELNAARRRAMFVLAAGGDPHRELDVGSVAAERLAAELDSAARRAALDHALAALAADAGDLPTVADALAALCKDPDLAWRSLALALLADELVDQ
jgi:hypothetical protein